MSPGHGCAESLVLRPPGQAPCPGSSRRTACAGSADPVPALHHLVRRGLPDSTIPRCRATLASLAQRPPCRPRSPARYRPNATRWASPASHCRSGMVPGMPENLPTSQCAPRRHSPALARQHANRESSPFHTPPCCSRTAANRALIGPMSRTPRQSVHTLHDFTPVPRRLCSCTHARLPRRPPSHYLDKFRLLHPRCPGPI